MSSYEVVRRPASFARSTLSRGTRPWTRYSSTSLYLTNQRRGKRRSLTPAPGRVDAALRIVALGSLSLLLSAPSRCKASASRHMLGLDRSAHEKEEVTTEHVSTKPQPPRPRAC